MREEEGAATGMGSTTTTTPLAHPIPYSEDAALGIPVTTATKKCDGSEYLEAAQDDDQEKEERLDKRFWHLVPRLKHVPLFDMAAHAWLHPSMDPKFVLFLEGIRHWLVW